MTFIDLFYLNDRLVKENRFTENQWTDIINEGFMHSNEWGFDKAVEDFYIHWLGFDYSDCENFITDIQSGDHNAMETFISDVYNYFSSIPIYKSNFLRKF